MCIQFSFGRHVGVELPNVKLLFIYHFSHYPAVSRVSSASDIRLVDIPTADCTILLDLPRGCSGYRLCLITYRSLCQNTVLVSILCSFTIVSAFP